jgi:FtsP/CotA-like multicopper oxidase with cupredoxin domain
MNTTTHVAPVNDDHFSRDLAGLPAAHETEIIDLTEADRYDLTAAPVRKQLGDAEAGVRMLAYNGSVPGPTLRVRQGSAVTIDFRNEADLENTVHWHGLRLENQFDGTHETQAPVPVGGRFSYRVRFPDPGVYWYHPHVREDYGQEMGLYGNIIVVPADEDYWSPAHREIALTLDDILLEAGAVAPFSRSETTHVAMGRFGNVLLVNGEPQRTFTAQRNEVVRFYLTNTANTRVFNAGFTGARMKLVGGDSGRNEREVFVESVMLAPSERVVIDVLFDTPGTAMLEHRTPGGTTTLATFAVSEEQALPSLVESFETLRRGPELTAERAALEQYLNAEPDKTLSFVATMSLGEPDAASGPVSYSCPMHPEVVSDEPGRCPLCGMALLAIAAPTPETYACPMHPEIVSETPGSCPICGMKLLPASMIAQAGGHHDHHGHHEPMEHGGHTAKHHGHQDEPAQDAHHGHHDQPAPDAHAHHGHHGHHEMAHEAHQTSGQDETWRGVEWEDDMVEVNRMTTPSNMRWFLRDTETGAEGHAIDWQFRVGERVKIRLVNEMDSDHPMHHPFHIHGAGRFLVLSRNGMTESNLVWNDTTLVRTGETVDILLDVTNPGVWMAHCHIAEHHESGMMLSFHVTE